MLTIETEQKITRFLARKNSEFPTLGLLGRQESRTIKFPLPRRVVHPAHL